MTGDKFEIRGRMIVNIKFGNSAYHQTVYVADIAGNFMLELDFLKERGFTLDFKKNGLSSAQEDIIIFKIGNDPELIQQITAKILQILRILQFTDYRYYHPSANRNNDTWINRK